MVMVLDWFSFRQNKITTSCRHYRLFPQFQLAETKVLRNIPDKRIAADNAIGTRHPRG
jgi:hypothetical protein